MAHFRIPKSYGLNFYSCIMRIIYPLTSRRIKDDKFRAQNRIKKHYSRIVKEKADGDNISLSIERKFNEKFFRMDKKR